jgi:hypothetical protein
MQACLAGLLAGQVKVDTPASGRYRRTIGTFSALFMVMSND